MATVVLVIALLVATPMMLSSGRAGRLDQIRDDVESLRAAELDHREAFGRYVTADAAPRPPQAVGAEPVPWSPSTGFSRLAWAPAEPSEVFASFSVSLTPTGFRVTGVSDLDGDGVPAMIEATEQSPATAISPSGVY